MKNYHSLFYIGLKVEKQIKVYYNQIIYEIK